jgi:hypothetical protein
MFAIVQNGAVRQVIQPDVEFTVGERKYSSNFIRNSSQQEKLEAGVWEIVYSARPDDRFYWVGGVEYRVNEVKQVVEGSYPATAKELEDKTETDGIETTTKGLKSQCIDRAKAQANSALSATDWMVMRKAERAIKIPAEVAAERKAIIARCAELEEAIAACSTVEELIAAIQSQVSV